VIRLLIAARSAIVRAGLESVSGSSPAITIVGGVEDPDDLARQIEEAHADVLLLDIDSREDQWLTAGRGVPAVVLGDHTAELLRSGARAVLPRNASPAEIVAAIEAAAAGLVVLHPETLERMLADLGQHALPGASDQPLTPREVQVLQMLAEGAANKTIAWRLNISEHTVKFHIASIFTKLNASSRTEAVMAGVRQGLILI
jgi:NarL family two-component system response regulator YdfI